MTNEAVGGGGIYRLTKRCNELFEAWLSREQPDAEEYLTFVDSQYRSFKVWTAYSGALASVNLSLDHRLKDHNHIKVAVTELLHLTLDCLSDSSLSERLPPVEQEPEPPGGEVFPRTSLQSHDNTRADLKDALESLHKLASAVRRSAAPNTKFNLSSRFSRIEGFYEPYYESLAKAFVHYRFPDANISLCDQIGRTMSQRRSWILFTQRRGVKLARNRDMVPMAPSLTSDVSSTAVLTPKGLPISHAPTHVSHEQISLSSLQASSPDSTLYRQFIQGAQASTSTARLKNRSETHDDRFEYPDPPVFKPAESRVPCPYCLEPLTVMTKEAWNSHYDRDTQPFICLSEDCTTPFKFFSSYNSWEKHMTDYHSIDWAQKVHSKDWACDIKHQEQVYTEKADFEKHLRIEHDHMSDAKIHVLLKRKQRIALREPATCPLCESSVKRVLPDFGTIKLQEQDPRKQLWRHISEHLHSLLKACVPPGSLTELEDHPPRSEKVDSDSLASNQRGSTRKIVSQSRESQAGDMEPLEFDDDDAKVDSDSLTSNQRDSSRENVSQSQESQPADMGPLEFDDDDDRFLSKVSLMDFRMGMNEVYSPRPGQRPVSNVVLVHGLFGGPWKTWAAKSKAPRNSPMSAEETASNASLMDGRSNYTHKTSKYVFWPESLLPLVVKNVKVYSFGYDADVEKFMSTAGLNTVHQHGRNLFNELYALRASQVPTIIIAHSLGGLVVKEALNQAAHSAQQEEREVVSNTSGIIFLGTPHRGSNAASYGRVAYLLTRTFAFQSASTKLLTALEKNSETLDRITTEFFHTLETYKNLHIASFSEEKEVRFGMLGMQIVKPDSAKIGHARETWGSISEDHRNMAKYTSPRDDGFVKVSRKIKEWVDDSQRYMSSTVAKVYEECLKSLNDPVARFRVQEVDPVRHYHKDTFEWLFTDQVPFRRWLRDDSGEFDALFWITGKPGSGKSTLMRFALEDSRTMSLQPKNSEGHPMAYFFHLGGKSQVQKSLRGMLMELLYQIMERYPGSFELVCPIFLKLKRLKQDWDTQNLSEAMSQIPYLPPSVPGHRDRITLFVDALDENETQDDNKMLLSIFDNLNNTYKNIRHRPDAPVLKVCLASRPWPIFQQTLGGNPRVPSFAIHDFTREDIQQYAQFQLLKNVHIGESSEQRQNAIRQLSSDIASEAKGVFVWVRVLVDNLSQDIIDGTPIESLQRMLHEYPVELEDMYKITLKRVRRAYRPEAKVVFKAVLASRTPLNILQLYIITQESMGLPPSKDNQTKYPEDITSSPPSKDDQIKYPEDITSSPPSKDDQTKYPEDMTSSPPSKDDQTKYPEDITSSPPSKDDRIKYPEDMTSSPLSKDDRIKYPEDMTSSPPSKDDQIKYPEDMISWLASRSGGLIDTVNTGAEEHLAQVEFIHQTVQHFVRNGLDDIL